MLNYLWYTGGSMVEAITPAPSAALEPLRDEHGLDLTQRQFLTTRASALTDYEALDNMGLTSIWLANQLRVSDFRRAYNQLFPFDPKAVTRDALRTILPKVVTELESALESEDGKRRQWAVERLLKVTGLEKLSIDVTRTDVPADLIMAKQFVERGVRIPPELLERLKGQGLIADEVVS